MKVCLNAFQESDTGSIPEWLKPLTQEPYPVNFMSAVKRKMAAKKTELEAPPVSLTFSTATTTSQPQAVVSHTFSSSNPFIPPVSHEPFERPTNGLFDLFPTKPTTTLVEKSQQTSKVTPPVSPEGFRDDSERESWSGQIIKTSVPPLPRLSSTTTEASSRVMSPELSAASPILVPPQTGFLEEEKEPVYESDFESACKSGEDTDAPSISSENRPGDSEIRLVTPNVGLFSDWSSRRDCGDGENASQESATRNGKDFEIGRLYNPEAIHLQFQAELNRLDAFNESLYHVMEVEKVRAVALAREQALLSTKATSQQSSPKSDKAISVQRSLPLTDLSAGHSVKGEVPTVNSARESSEVPNVNSARGSGEVPTVHSARGSSEDLTVNSARVSSEVPTVNSARVSSEVPTVHSARVSSEVPTVNSARVSSEVPTANSARGSSEVPTVNYTRGADAPPKLDSAEVQDESIKTEIAGTEVSTESPSSPVATSQPSSVPEKSASPQSSDTVSEEPKSHKSPHEIRPHKEKGQKRLRSRQTDKISSDSRGSRVGDESTEPSVPDTNRSGEYLTIIGSS